MADDNHVRASVRVQQIITAAILLGLVAFGAVTLVLAGQRPPGGPAQLPILTYLAVGLAVLNLVLAFALPRLVVRSGMHRIARQAEGAPGAQTRSLLGLRQAAHIVSIALLEGAGFLGCIAYLVEGDAVGLAVPAVMALAIGSLFPTVRRVETWLEWHQQRLIELRMDSRQGQA